MKFDDEYKTLTSRIISDLLGISCGEGNEIGCAQGCIFVFSPKY